MKKSLFVISFGLALLGAGCSDSSSTPTPTPTPMPTSVASLQPATSSASTAPQPSSTSSSPTAVEWKTYSNRDRGFTVKYPSDVKIEEVLINDASLPNYLALHFTGDNGDQMQIYVNPGGHGNACMNPEQTETPKDIVRIIGGIKVIGQTCSNGFTENFGFTRGGDEFEILLQGKPASQASFHQILATFTFIGKQQKVTK